MAYRADDVIKIAKAEVGYLEKKTNKSLDDKTANAGDKNYTKYARDLSNMKFYNGNKQGVAWCDMFVDWCFVKAFGEEGALAVTFQPTDNKKNYGAGCKYSRDYYKKNGRLFDTPQPGDQIFFYNSSKTSIAHTGLVYKVDKTYVYTIEGNTSSASGVVANGGCVAEKKYKLNYNRLAGYGRPKYDSVVIKVEEETKVESKPEYQCIHTVVRGDSLWKIATKYLGKGSRYTEIKTLNGLKSNTIYAGTKLKIPNK